MLLLLLLNIVDQIEKKETKRKEEKETLSYKGYDLRWSDDFNGNSLNRDDWNVETHEPGWVNAELQEYVDGSWVGYPDDTTNFDDQAYVIDYVVYADC